MNSEWLHYATLRGASLPAPGNQRAEWVQEWQPELWYIPRRGATTPHMGFARWLDTHAAPMIAFDLNLDSGMAYIDIAGPGGLSERFFMKTKLVVSFAGMLLSAALPILAHHSFAAEFDDSKKVMLKGSVVKVEWMNPHIWLYLDAKDDSGKMIRWQCEGGPPNTLTRNGWTKDALKEGDQITIDGFKAKDGSNTCNARSVTLPSGQKVFAGSAEGPKAE